MSKNERQPQPKLDLSQFSPRRNLSVPNLLSLLRIGLIPFIMSAYLQQNRELVVLLLLISGLSDALDGLIARRFHQITPLGKVLDPIADKLTQLALALGVCLAYPVVIPLALILLVKELLMLWWGLRLLRWGQPPFSACWWGKLSTCTFYIGVIIIILFESRLSPPVITLIGYLMALTLLFSMLRYGFLFKKKIRG